MMLRNWLDYLKSGLSHDLPRDQISDERGYTNSRAALRNLLPFLARHWHKGILGAGLILFTTILSFPQPLLNRYLLDNVILTKQVNLLPAVILLLGGLKISGMIADTLQQYYFTRFEQEMSLDIQQDLLNHALRLPKSFFDQKEVGYLISRLSSDVRGLRWFFSSNIVHIVNSLLRFIGGVVLLFYLEWRLGIVTIVLLPMLVIGARYFSSRMRALSHRGMEQYANVIQRFEETLASMSLIKAFASEGREGKRVMSEVRAGRQIEMEQTVVGSLTTLVFNTVPDFARAIVLIAGAYLVIRGEWTLGSLLAFQSYLGYVYSPALALVYSNFDFQNAMAALERVSAIYEIVPEENTKTGHDVEHLKGDVQFDSVSFSYNGREMVLQDISFHVSPGEQVAIVGPSGVGKTTLVSLLLRFYRPTGGEILFDSEPAAQFKLSSLRQRIGYVSQSTLLLAGTIRENLCYGNPDASQAEIERAAQAAGIRDFILGLPDGYESRIGERGVNLSEGQKQRLSIARALVKAPDILILDEPTSALDSIVEKSIFEALPDYLQGKTLFVVAHRLSTIQSADRIMLLNEKRLVATGTHRELLAENEYYRSLFQ